MVQFTDAREAIDYINSEVQQRIYQAVSATNATFDACAMEALLNWMVEEFKPDSWSDVMSEMKVKFFASLACEEHSILRQVFEGRLLFKFYPQFAPRPTNDFLDRIDANLVSVR